MGTLSVNQANHYYWLGRYVARVQKTLMLSSRIYDMLLDDESDFDLHEFCSRLSIPDIYEGPDDFITRYLFDENDPNSVISNLNRAFDNAIVMRDCLHSVTLSYIQLALNTMKAGAKSPSPMLELQETLDYLYAFWGALDDNLYDSRARYTILAGGSVERLDLALRLGLDDARIREEGMRLSNRLARSGMKYDSQALQRINYYIDRADWRSHVNDMLADVNGLVEV